MSIDHQLDDEHQKERRIRATEHETQANLAAVLQLCATGKLRCSEKTRRPSAVTVAAITEVLDDGDFYEHEAIAAFAWPLLLQAGGLATLAAGRLTLTPRWRPSWPGTDACAPSRPGWGSATSRSPSTGSLPSARLPSPRGTRWTRFDDHRTPLAEATAPNQRAGDEAKPDPEGGEPQ